MTHSATQEAIEFAGRMGPVKQFDIEIHLGTDCKSVARIGFLKGIVLDVKRVHFSKQNAPSLLLLLAELTITLFVAGIVLPSFLRSGVDAREALVRGSLHSIRIAGIAFSYTYENLGCAMLGMLTGAAAAFLVAYPTTAPDSEDFATGVQDDRPESRASFDGSMCSSTQWHRLRKQLARFGVEFSRISANTLRQQIDC